MTLSEYILRTLNESKKTFIPTPDLIAALGTELSHARQRFHTELRKLYESGLIQKTYVRTEPRESKHRYKPKGWLQAAWRINNDYKKLQQNNEKTKSRIASRNKSIEAKNTRIETTTGKRKSNSGSTANNPNSGESSSRQSTQTSIQSSNEMPQNSVSGHL